MRSPPPLAVLLALPALLVPAAALAEGRARIVQPSGGHATEARIGDEVELRVEIVRRGHWTAPPATASVRWLRVAPHMQHVDTAPPNEGVPQYSNAVLFGPRHGRWLGYDAIEYETLPLDTGERVDIDADRLRVRGVPDRRDGAGSMWLAAEVELADGTTYRTPDGDDTDRLGLSAAVARVSFRTGDDFLGWLSSYFGVPNVFGSTAGQADRHVGADCADVLVGALRAAGHRRVRYASVSGIARYANPVTPSLTLGRDGSITDDDGDEVVLRWDEDIRPGDLLAIDFVRSGARMPRAWDHIGALLGDGSSEHPPDGMLDSHDLLRHMAPSGLVDWPIGSSAPIRFRVWRWKPRAALRARRH